MSVRRSERPLSVTSSSAKVNAPEMMADQYKDAPTSSASSASIPVAGEYVGDLLLNRQAVRFIFEARFDDSALLLNSSRKTNTSPSVSATQSLVCFTQALVTYESSKIAEALQLWKRTEKLCSGGKNDTVEDKLEHRVILADTKICSTFLQLLQSADFGGLLKGSWALRQAWGIYQSTYDELIQLIEVQAKQKKLTSSQVTSLISSLPETEAIKNSVLNLDREFCSQSFDQGEHSEDITIDPINTKSNETRVQFDRIHQILGAVCYGYGLFHLMLSLLPGNLTKWLRFLGFEGNMKTGLQALTYCMYSPDSKALLSRVTLIWFYTIIQTYYAVEEDQLHDGMDNALRLLEGLDGDLRSSPLIQFFDCRLKRFKHDTEGAIVEYNQALARSGSMKEIDVLVHHELGILRFQLEQWDLAEPHLTKCYQEGRWGKSLYAYLLGITQIMLNNSSAGIDLISRVHSMIVMKNAPLEMFLADRSTQLSKEFKLYKGDSGALLALCSLLAMEIIYFLNCPKFIPLNVVTVMLKNLTKMKTTKYLPLRFLMQGRLHQFLREQDHALENFEQAVKSGDEQKGGAGCGEHVPAFSCYELGVVLSGSLETYEEGEEFLQKATDCYRNCHFRNRLHVRCHLAGKTFAGKERTVRV